MSAKQTADKELKHFPWTPRQKRQKINRRLVRKQVRRASRNR